MLIYVPEITTRVRYVFDFIGREILQQGMELTSDRGLYLDSSEPVINYSPERIRTGEFFIENHPLLFENTISAQKVDCFEENGYKAFFRTGGDFPFDIFAASFYLLSRYEEYLPHKKDSYGRYAHENSLAFREGFLKSPLVNIWLKHFKDVLKAQFPGLAVKKGSFLFLPTYDIDIAWSYRHKGWWRQAGGMCRSLIRGKWTELEERAAVIRGKKADPYDAYGWLNRLHQASGVKPYYFFLLAGKAGRYDKNISPSKKAMRDLVSDHIIRYPVGIHPSWQSGDRPGLLTAEMAVLSFLNGSPVKSSRQHYIRFELPGTFRRLTGAGIAFDFSMGYGSINGFRASVATPFYWYDLAAETSTDLLLFPFCFMEANSFFEQKDSPQQALAEMRDYYRVIQENGGTYCMIWHNFFLGTDKRYAGWKDVYEQFIREISSGKETTGF